MCRLAGYLAICVWGIASWGVFRALNATTRIRSGKVRFRGDSGRIRTDSKFASLVTFLKAKPRSIVDLPCVTGQNWLTLPSVCSRLSFLTWQSRLSQ